MVSRLRIKGMFASEKIPRAFNDNLLFGLLLKEVVCPHEEGYGLIGLVLKNFREEGCFWTP